MGGAKRTQATDEVEATMDAEGAVLHREKSVSRFLAIAMLVLTLLMLASALTLGLDAGASWTVKYLPWPLAMLGIYVGLTGTVVRTVVTTKEVRVLWGLRGLRIPLSAIAACRVVSVPPAIEGHESYAPHIGSEVLTVEWTDGEKTRRAVIGAESPRRLAESIQEARLRLAGKRIEADGDADEIDAAVVETAADRELEA